MPPSSSLLSPARVRKINLLRGPPSRYTYATHGKPKPKPNPKTLPYSPTSSQRTPIEDIPTPPPPRRDYGRELYDKITSKLTSRFRPNQPSQSNQTNTTNQSNSHNPSNPANRNSFLRTTIRTALIVLNSAIALHILTKYVADVSSCAGPSMLPTLLVSGDWVLTSKLHSGGQGVKVGDLVSFEHPVRQGIWTIKRVVGVGGDFVLEGTPQLPGKRERTEERMIQVPPNHLWVVGDNLEWSRDSRHYGPVPMGLVRGRVLARVLPWGTRTWFAGGLEERDVGVE